MDAAQLAALIQGVAAGVGNGGRGNRRLTVFTSADGSEWRVWRRNFLTIATINGWNDQRGRREISAGMEGAAARAVSDLLPDNFATQQLMLDAYELRFLPEAAGQLARSELKNAAQTSQETLLQWHTRLREIFSRAFPARAVDADQQLIDTYTDGLVDINIQRHVLDRHPATFIDALHLGQSKQATEAVVSRNKARGGLHSVGAIGSDQSVDALGRGNTPGKGNCWFCQSPDHVRANCETFKKQKEYFARFFKVDGKKDEKRTNQKSTKPFKKRWGGGKKTTNSMSQPEVSDGDESATEN
jgi:hypothetical protein